MKSMIYKKALLACIILFLFSFNAWADAPIPKPKGLVNDFAGVISDQNERKILSIASEILNKTEIPIVVVTMSDIGGDEYSDYANRLYSSWGIGKKGEDKGVLLFVTIKERKTRIETGYGVEGILPDGLVGEIRDRYMIPYFKKDDFGEGLLMGTAAVAQVIAKNAGIALDGKVPVKKIKKKKSALGILPVIIILILIMGFSRRRGGFWFILLPLLLGGGRGYGSGSGGGFGGFSGGFGGFGGGMSGGGGAGGGF